jgi:Ni/Co efflux regulator RcnB
MRKLLISLLLAGAAATPALAQPGDDHDRQQTRSERQEARSERQAARVERQESRSERPQFTGQPRFNGAANGAQQSFARSNGVQQNVQQNLPQLDAAQMQAFRADRQRLRQEQANGGDFDGRERNARMRQRQQVLQGRATVADETLRQSDRPVPNILRARDRSPMVSDTPRAGTQPPLRVDNRRRDQVAWNTNWRHDGRHDWRSWRDRHRSFFHLGFYYDPFGWGYQPYSIGWRLWPSYYGSNYWINDPWQYRLPYAPAGTRWVRYYNDALLVDTFTGEVVDVIRGFFW